jgi:hypothetical protein
MCNGSPGIVHHYKAGAVGSLATKQRVLVAAMLYDGLIGLAPESECDGRMALSRPSLYREKAPVIALDYPAINHRTSSREL